MKRLAICFVLVSLLIVAPVAPALAQTATPTPLATPDGSGCFDLSWGFEDQQLGIWDADAGETSPAITTPGNTGSYAAWMFFSAVTTRVANVTKEEMATYFGTDIITADDFTISGYARASDINGASSYLRIIYTDASYSEYLLNGLTTSWSLISQAGTAGKYVDSVRISVTRNTTSSNAAFDDLNIDYCQPATPTPTPTETATPTITPSPTPSVGCTSNSWTFEGGIIGEWATTGGTEDMAASTPGYGSSYAMYAEDAAASWYEQAIVGTLDLPGLGYDVGEIATWTGVYSTTNAISGYISLRYTDGYSSTVNLPATSSWTGFFFESDGREIQQFIITVQGDASTTAAFDNLVIEFCPAPTATPTTIPPTPTVTPTPWATVYPTTTPLPTFTPVSTWIPNLSEDPFDIIPPLPPPIEITDTLTYTLAITQFWNLDNLAIIISTARTMPILFNRNHMLDLLLIIGLIVLVVFIIARINVSRGSEL